LDTCVSGVNEFGGGGGGGAVCRELQSY